MPYMFPVLITKGLSFAYPNRTPSLIDFNVSIEPGSIHAVVGLSGSGKSTLVSVLTGQLEASAGTIHIQGQLSGIKVLKDPIALGIRTVNRPRVLSGRTTVAEALYLDAIPTRFGLVDTKERNRRAANLLSMYGLAEVQPSDLLCSLSAGKQKLVEIASVLHKSCSLLILDDPSAALTHAEAVVLYAHLAKLRFAGVAILFLTTSPEEALEVGDQVSVLREGRLVSTHDPDTVFVHQLRGEMEGRDLSLESVAGKRQYGPEIVIRLDNLGIANAVDGVNLKVKRGEVFGLLGLAGAGQSEVVSAVGGAIPAQEGSMTFKSSTTVTRFTSPDQAMAIGIGWIPDPSSTVSKEPKQPSSKPLARPMRGLNESNPQKAVVMAALQMKASILAFDQPTRGLNIGNRVEMWRLIPDLAEQGLTILVASTDADELIRMCDRIAVMQNGWLIKILEREEFSLEKLTALMKGH